MTWTKLGDEFADRPDVLRVPYLYRYVHVEALMWCNKHLTDGLVPRSALRRITEADDPEQAADALVAAGLWEPRLDGWQIDWTDQRTKEAVLAEREYERNRKDRARRHSRDDHSLCTAGKCRGVKGVSRSGTPVRDAATESARASAVVSVVPTRPVPSPLEGAGIGVGDRTGSAAGAAARPAPKKNWRKVPGEHETYVVEGWQ